MTKAPKPVQKIVYDKRDPSRLGHIIAEGSEVSEIKWIDKIDPKREFVNNKYIMEKN